MGRKAVVPELGSSVNIYTPDPVFTRHLKRVQQRVNIYVQTGEMACVQRQIADFHGIFQTRGWNLGLLPCKRFFYYLGHQGSPINKAV